MKKGEIIIIMSVVITMVIVFFVMFLTAIQEDRSLERDICVESIKSLGNKCISSLEQIKELGDLRVEIIQNQLNECLIKK